MMPNPKDWHEMVRLAKKSEPCVDCKGSSCKLARRVLTSAGYEPTKKLTRYGNPVWRKKS